MGAFLITFRESLEAGVIVGMLFAILHLFEKRKKDIYLWAGVGAGIISSLLFAWFFHAFLGGFEGKNEKIYEGILMFVACGLITHMVFWMREKGKCLKRDVADKIHGILKKKTLWMLAVLSFCAVIREGIETVIFLNAIEAQGDGAISLLWGIFGIVAAVALSYGIYFSSHKLNPKRFFQVSGMLLLVIAAGLLAHGIVEFQGAGWFPIIKKPVYDLSFVFSEKEGLGLYLKALFGYDANPSIIAVVGYWLFITIVGWMYFGRKK